MGMYAQEQRMKILARIKDIMIKSAEKRQTISFEKLVFFIQDQYGSLEKTARDYILTLVRSGEIRRDGNWLWYSKELSIESDEDKINKLFSKKKGDLKNVEGKEEGTQTQN